MVDAIGNAASVAITLSNGESSLENLESSVKLLDGGDGVPRASNGGNEEEVSTAPTSTSTLGVNSTTRDADNNHKKEELGSSKYESHGDGYGVEGEASMKFGESSARNVDIRRRNAQESYNEGYGVEGEVSLKFGESVSADVGNTRVNSGQDEYGVEGELSLKMGESVSSIRSNASSVAGRRKSRSRSRDKAKASSGLKAPSTPSKAPSTLSKDPSTPSKAPSTPTSSSKSPYSRSTPRSKERRRRVGTKPPRSTASDPSKSPAPGAVSPHSRLVTTTPQQQARIPSTPDSSISRDSTTGSVAESVASFYSTTGSEPNSPPSTSASPAGSFKNDSGGAGSDVPAPGSPPMSNVVKDDDAQNISHATGDQKRAQQSPAVAPTSLASNLYMIGRRDEDESERYEDDGTCTMVDTMVDTVLDDVSVASSSVASFYSAALPEDEEEGHRSASTFYSVADRPNSDRSQQQSSQRSQMSHPQTPRRQSSRSRPIGDDTAEGERTPSGRSRRSSSRRGADGSRSRRTSGTSTKNDEDGVDDDNMSTGSNHARSRSRRGSRKGADKDEEGKRHHRSRSRHSSRSADADGSERSRSKSRHRSKSEKRRHGSGRHRTEDRSRSTSRGALERKAKARAEAEGKSSSAEAGSSNEEGGVAEVDRQELQTPKRTSRRIVERKSSNEGANLSPEAGPHSPPSKSPSASSENPLGGKSAESASDGGETSLVATPKKANRAACERKSSTDSEEILSESQRGSKAGSKSNARSLVERYSSDSDGGLKGATSKPRKLGEGSTTRRLSSKSPTGNRHNRRARKLSIQSSLEQMLSGGAGGGEDLDKSFGSILTYDTTATSDTTSSRRRRSPHGIRHRSRRRSKDKTPPDESNDHSKSDHNKSIVSIETTSTQDTMKAGSGSPHPRRSRRYSNDDALPITPDVENDDHNQSVSSIQRTPSMDSASLRRHSRSNSGDAPPADGVNRSDDDEQSARPLKRIASLDSASSQRRHSRRSNSGDIPSTDEDNMMEDNHQSMPSIQRSASSESKNSRRKHRGDETPEKHREIQRTKSDGSSSSPRRSRSNSADSNFSPGSSPKPGVVQRTKSDGSTSGRRRPGSKSKDIASPDVEGSSYDDENKMGASLKDVTSQEPSFRLTSGDGPQTSGLHAGESSASLNASKLHESTVSRRRSRSGSRSQIVDDEKNELAVSAERAKARRARRNSKDRAPAREDDQTGNPSSATENLLDPTESVSVTEQSESATDAPASEKSEGNGNVDNDGIGDENQKTEAHDDMDGPSVQVPIKENRKEMTREETSKSIEMETPSSKPASAVTVDSKDCSASLSDMRIKFQKDFPGVELPPDELLRSHYRVDRSPAKSSTSVAEVKGVPMPTKAVDGVSGTSPRRLTREDRDGINESSSSSIGSIDLMKHLEAAHGKVRDKNNSSSGGDMSMSEISTQSETVEASASQRQRKRMSLHVIKKMLAKPKNALFKKGSHGDDKAEEDEAAAASSPTASGDGTDNPETEDVGKKKSNKDLKEKVKEESARELEKKDKEAKELEKKDKEAKELEKKEKEAKELEKKKEKEAKELEKKKEKEAKELEKKKEKEAKELEKKEKKEAKEQEKKAKLEAKLAKDLEKKEKEKAKKEKKEQEKREKKEKAKLEKKEKAKKDKLDKQAKEKEPSRGSESEQEANEEGSGEIAEERQESAPTDRRKAMDAGVSSRDLLMKSIRDLENTKGKKKGLKAVKLPLKAPGVLKRTSLTSKSLTSGVKRLSGLLNFSKSESTEGWGDLVTDENDAAASTRFLSTLQEGQSGAGEKRPNFADASDDEMDFGGNDSFVVSNEAMQFCFDGKAAITHVSSEESGGDLIGQQQQATMPPQQDDYEASDNDDDDNNDDEYDDASSDDESYDPDDYQDSYVPTLLSHEQLATVVEVDDEVDLSTHGRNENDRKKKERGRRKSKHGSKTNRTMPTGRARMAPTPEVSDAKKDDAEAKERNRRARRQRSQPSSGAAATSEKTATVSSTSKTHRSRKEADVKPARDKSASDRTAEVGTEEVPSSPRKRSARTSRPSSGTVRGGGDKASGGSNSDIKSDYRSSPRKERKARLHNFLEQADQEIEDEYGELDLEDVDPDENVAFEEIATPVRLRRHLKPGAASLSPSDKSLKSVKSTDMPVAFRSDSSKPALPNIFSGANIGW